MPSSLRQWIADHREQIPADPVRGLFHAVYTFYLGLWYTITSRWPIGTHVYDDEWDLLIILDACRVDVLESVADEYDFIENVDSRWSVGSHSHEWLTQTFSEDYREEVATTAYVSGNGHTYETFVTGDHPPDETVPFCWPNWRPVDVGDFGQLDMLWETAHKEDVGVPPRAITDRTVEVGRESGCERLITHYMQPHIPYIADALGKDRAPTDIEARGWKAQESGDAERDVVWELYEENLRLVLDEVELLLENVDADDVVITADHGNAFGKYSIYGHPEGMPLPCVKRVPWVETSASDTHSFEPSGEYRAHERSETTIEEHLADLGYK